MTDERDPRLDRLAAPPAGVDFRSNVWDRIDRRERALRRRRRAAAASVAGIALIAASAAGVFAFGEQTRPLDRTISCPLPEQGGVNVLELAAHVKAPPVHYGGNAIASPALVTLSPGANGLSQSQYAGVTSVNGGYLFDQTVCKGARTIPLARSGLPLTGTYRGASGAGIQEECWLAPTIVIRMHVTFGHPGVPVSARIAVRAGARLHPVAYIEWAPALVRAYVSPSCQVR